MIINCVYSLMLGKKMLELQEKSIAMRFERSDEQIFEEILRKTFGFNKNFAYCLSQHHASDVTLK